MSAPRLVGLLLTSLVLTVAAVSAQVQPPIKPPANPMPKPGDPGKGKNPPPKPKPADPKQPPKPGLPPVVIVPPGSPPTVKKKDETKWPKDVNGKTVEVVVKEMRSHSDPGVREAAVRMLPLFGPRGREFGGEELVEAMTKDPDWGVRLAALDIAPTVLFGHLVLIEGAPDKMLFDGMNAMINMINSEHMNVRFEALASVASIGPYIRVASAGKIISVLTSRARESTSWHMRRAGVAALGQVGVGMPKDDDPSDRLYPDQATVTTLLDVLRLDSASAVRREAVNSLVLLGEVAPTQQKKWRADLDSVLARDKDKSVQLWVRVCILANDPKGVEGNEPHLNAVAVVLQAPEPAGRLEACQAFAHLGDDAKAKLQDLLNLIQNPNEEPAIVAAGIAAVATMKSQAKITVPIMDKLKLTHPSADVKAVATEASDILSGRKKN